MNWLRTFLITFAVLGLLAGGLIALIEIVRVIADAAGVPWENARGIFLLVLGLMMLAGSVAFISERRRSSGEKAKNDELKQDVDDLFDAPDRLSYTIGADGELTPIDDENKLNNTR